MSPNLRFQLNRQLKDKIIRICDQKIAAKGENVGLSFYAFFANKNDDTETLMQMAGGKLINGLRGGSQAEHCGHRR